MIDLPAIMSGLTGVSSAPPPDPSYLLSECQWKIGGDILHGLTSYVIAL
jgi:hypothetical protein